MALGVDSPGDLAIPAVDDEVFVALSDRRRRFALYYLRWRGRADVDELADVVAGWRGADRRGAVSRGERNRVRATLLEWHLPVLADADLVAVDGATGSVAIEPLSGPVGSLIDFAYDVEGGGSGTSARS